MMQLFHTGLTKEITQLLGFTSSEVCRGLPCGRRKPDVKASEIRKY